MAKKNNLMSEYTCPYCFDSINLGKIHYQCTNPVCTPMFINILSDKDRRKYSFNGEEIDIEYSIFLGKSPVGSDPVTTKQHIIKNSSGICDICKKPVYRRLCPSCHNPIPPGAEEEGSAVFVVLGPKGVGKSHYIAVLINQLTNSFAPEFGATMSPATDKTTVKYRDIYYKRLYEDKRKLAPTISYKDSSESREPMIYYLRFIEGNKPKVYTLAFFDMAGEDLESSNKILEYNLNSFISRASGLVFLVDPLQIPYINNRIHVENKPSIGPNFADILANITNTIRMNNQIKGKNRIPIPLAVVITKCDVLLKSQENEEEARILLGLNSAIHIERERGKYDKINFEQISVEMEEYMRRATSNDFVQMVKEFEHYSYFAVSSIGSNPVGSVLTKGISPLRVEDPFIWLLNYNETKVNKND